MEESKEVQEVNPDEMAKVVFGSAPKLPGSYVIYDVSETDNEYIFQMILTFFMEGLAHFNDDLKQVDLTKFNIDVLQSLKPYMRSVGFDLNVEQYDQNNESDNEYYNKYYCKIVLKQQDWFRFESDSRITKNYLFSIKPYDNIERNNFTDYYAIFYKNNVEVYKISFDFYRDTTEKVFVDRAVKELDSYEN